LGGVARVDDPQPERSVVERDDRDLVEQQGALGGTGGGHRVGSRQLALGWDLARAVGELVDRAGRHREIAVYGLEDVRATSELYEKITPTLLTFNKEFRDAEERAAAEAARLRRQEGGTIADAPSVLDAIVPSSEGAFIESLNANSVELSASLERSDVDVSKSVVSTRHQAIVLEKLMGESEADDDFPPGI